MLHPPTASPHEPVLDRHPSMLTILAAFAPLLFVLIFTSAINRLIASYSVEFDRWVWFVDGFLLVLGALALAGCVLARYTSRVVITQTRAQVRTGGLLAKTIDLSLADVERVELAPSTLQSFLGLRTIEFIGINLPRGRVSLMPWRDAEPLLDQLQELVANATHSHTRALDMLSATPHEPSAR